MTTDVDPVARRDTSAIAMLQRIGAALAELDPDRLIQRITDEATALCRAQFGAFFYNVVRPGGESYMLYTLSGAPRSAFAGFAMPRNTDVFRPTFHGTEILRLADVTKDPRYGRSAPHHGMPPGHLPVRSYLAVPVFSRGGEVLGGLFFGHAEPDVFTAHDEQLMAAVATQTGLALDNARLHAAAEAREQQYRFLAEATAVLAGSHDHRATLTEVARLAVPRIADYCAIDLLGADGSVQRLAASHADPAQVPRLLALGACEADRQDTPGCAAQALRSGVPALLEDLRPADDDDPRSRLLRELGACSCICAPIPGRGRPLGAIVLGSARDDRRFGPADLRVAEDLATRAGAAVENARLYREAQEANRAKDQFLATVSHELRTPLTAILGWTRMLRSDQLDDERRHRGLETIERSARAQTQLIEDLLDISRIISGKLRLDARAIDPIDPIEAAYQAVVPAAEARSVRLTRVLATNAGPIVADPDRLQQVVWNLLTNAVKFTPRGGSVKLRLRRVESSAEVTVSDTGQGIPPGFLRHVFELFRQADAELTRKHGGLGIGLAITRHLVELHGGTIEAHSEGEGRGATFIVRLPLGPLRVREPELAPGVEAAADGFTCPPEIAGLRVLVVDDEPDVRELLGAVLTSCRAEVLFATNADEALAVLQKERPDVLVSDIGMPGEDGYALIRRVRALAPDAGGKTPALALTAFARMEDRTRALIAGFQMHVPKPLDPTELVVVLANLAGRVG